MLTMSKGRMEEVIENLANWAAEHDDEFVADFIKAADLTKNEIEELELDFIDLDLLDL